MTPDWFDDLPVIGQLSPDEIERRLSELEAEEGRLSFELPRFFSTTPRLWQHTFHAFGYIPPLSGSETVPLQNATTIKPDLFLSNQTIKITLDKLRIASYPGRGNHRILFDFYAQNQTEAGLEHLHFNATYRVREGEQAPIVGHPIFIGLNVGHEGVMFRCYTVNINNDDDEKLIAFLEGDTFHAGLKLVSGVQPALGLLSQMAYHLTRTIASRHRNIPVQDFYLGLDFSSIQTRAKLAVGSYVAVQAPADFELNWADYHYVPQTGQIIKNSELGQILPFNYIVFSVSRHDVAGGTNKGR